MKRSMLALAASIVAGGGAGYAYNSLFPTDATANPTRIPLIIGGVGGLAYVIVRYL